MKNTVYNLIKENEGIIYKLASKYSSYYELDDLYRCMAAGF